MDVKNSKEISIGLLELDVVIFMLCFALGYVQGGLVGAFALIAYGLLLGLITLLSIIPFAGIFIFYYLAGLIPHFYMAYSYYHIIFLIQSIFAWIFYLATTIAVILLISRR